MLYVNEQGEGVEIPAGREDPVPAAKTAAERRRIRDRALLLWHRAGLTIREIVEILETIAREPRKLTYIARRLKQAAALSEKELRELRLRRGVDP